MLRSVAVAPWATAGSSRRRFGLQTLAGTMNISRPRVLLLGPALDAVSGVSTHLNQIIGSTLSACCKLTQFRVGGEGRVETRARMLLRALASPFWLAACLARRRPHIVHINTSLDPKAYWRDLTYLAVAKLFRRKVVYQVHGGLMPAELFAGNRPLTFLLRRVLSSAEAVVLLSRRELAAYREFAPAAHLMLIANAIDVRDADLGAGRYVSGPLEIVYLGRLAHDKGILDVVRAVAVLRDRGIQARLSVAGAGPAEQRLREAITAARLWDRVRLLGPVFGSEKQRLWLMGHVFAFPTFHCEGLPYALLESMAAGAVPIAVPVGAIPDVMEDGVHGIFVPQQDPPAIADALERLHGDRARLHRMALAGRQRIVEHYSIARLASDLRRLYVSLVTN